MQVLNFLALLYPLRVEGCCEWGRSCAVEPGALHGHALLLSPWSSGAPAWTPEPLDFGVSRLQNLWSSDPWTCFKSPPIELRLHVILIEFDFVWCTLMYNLVFIIIVSFYLSYFLMCGRQVFLCHQGNFVYENIRFIMMITLSN